MGVVSDKRVLVVEDDRNISRLITLHLADLGCDVRPVATATEALFRTTREPFDLIILDLMLPDRDGLDLCRELRGRENTTPILIVSARSEEVDRILGLELGADDYMVKPFSVRELAARVKALFRREAILAADQGTGQKGPILVEALRIDPEKRRVEIGGEPVHLTAKEFDLLLQFASNPGRVYTRAELLDLVWGYGAGCYEHTVNSHINRLRSKIEVDPSNPRYVQTVWGVGYRFLDSEAAGGPPAEPTDRSGGTASG